MKTLLARCLSSELVLFGVFSCCFALSAQAQNSSPTTQVTPASTASASPTKGIGPAPAHTPQNHILNVALSPETRQTLQEAMNSARASDTSHLSTPAK